MVKIVFVIKKITLFYSKLFQFVKCGVMLFSYYKELKVITPSEVVLVCGDVDRSFDSNGIKYSPVLDSLNDILITNKIKTISVASPFSNYFGKKAYGNVVSVNAIFSKNIIKHRLLGLYKRDYYNNIAANEESWNIILQKICPKIIIGIQPCPELCYVAYKKKIQVIDIQHGVISSEGYYNIEYFQKIYFNNYILPNLILCWDSQSSKAIKQIFNNKVNTLIIGNLWYKKFNDLNSNDSLVISLNNRVSQIKKTNFTILVTLQWGEESEDEKFTLGINKNLINFINKNSRKYNWWIKIHPMLLRGKNGIKYKKELSRILSSIGNIDFNICSTLPLPFLLKNVDLHITSHSAVTIEASWFGVKTALFYERIDLLYEYFSEQINSGIADIVECTDLNLQDWLNKNEKFTETKYLHFSDYRDNIDLLIKNIKENV